MPIKDYKPFSKEEKEYILKSHQEFDDSKDLKIEDDLDMTI